MLPKLFRARGAPARVQDNAGGRQTLGRADAGNVRLPATHYHRAWRDVDRCASSSGRVDAGAEHPVVDTFVALTCTEPVVEEAQIPGNS